MASLPNIRDFYAGRSVFITGATGFMGKVLVEKLLRSCPEISKIYLLVRAKRGVSPNDRLISLLDCKLFDYLSEQQPQFRDKVIPVIGDMLDEGLGISEEDLELLIRDVSLVFHSAATVRFDERLKLSVKMNMVGVQRMLELARKMTHLEAFVHVSTAYANCDRTEIEEKIYPTQLAPQKLIDSIEWMSDDVMDTLSPKLVSPRPNTYTFTKAQAERILEEDAKDLPVSIVRPSIVGASWNEPFPGWVDNFNGPTGLFAAIGKGALRMMMGRRNGAADIIPVDMATNLFIAAAWRTALERTDDIVVYNCTTGGLNTLYWGQLDTGSENHYNYKTPLDAVARLPKAKFTTSRFRRNMNLYFDHLLPAWLMDATARAVGAKPMYMRLQQRLWKSVEVLEYFTSREWKWTNHNVVELNDKLSPEDRKEFDFDVRNIDWTEYLDNYCLGTKKYVLKESMEALPAARQNILWLQRRDQFMKCAMAALLIVILQRKSQTFQVLTKAAIQHFTGLAKYLPVIR